MNTKIVFAVLLFLGAAAFAQVNTASLTGLVKDSSDAVIGDAKVIARSTATGVERSTETNWAPTQFPWRNRDSRRPSAK